MRWLSTASPGVAANGATMYTLNPSPFLFVMARPLPNCPVTLALYVSPTLR